ncbi:MAG: hypothetical protein KatS3mg076_1390 [Candidatus Binatia bacterium]|nr:MAG: hypothetical protein KatS3mg076_1390 [Candidatus Binatia bacterium]
MTVACISTPGKTSSKGVTRRVHHRLRRHAHEDDFFAKRSRRGFSAEDPCRREVRERASRTAVVHEEGPVFRDRDRCPADLERIHPEAREAQRGFRLAEVGPEDREGKRQSKTPPVTENERHPAADAVPWIGDDVEVTRGPCCLGELGQVSPEPGRLEHTPFSASVHGSEHDVVLRERNVVGPVSVPEIEEVTENGPARTPHGLYQFPVFVGNEPEGRLHLAPDLRTNALEKRSPVGSSRRLGLHDVETDDRSTVLDQHDREGARPSIGTRASGRIARDSRRPRPRRRLPARAGSARGREGGNRRPYGRASREKSTPGLRAP